ncbi:serpin B4-like [Cloeon dipterum]|uniref:serpin B4-like n=1 Tax=Cloeon dipterum TaxID=197152 RepID=UPI00321F93BB
MSSSDLLDVAPFNGFGQSFHKVLNNRTEGNVVASSLSCMMALGMIYFGSKDLTRSVMSKALQLPEDQFEAASKFQAMSTVLEGIKGVELALGNKAFVSESTNILPEYLTVLNQSFNASPESINFLSKNSSSIVNGWVKNVTRGKIVNLFKDDDFSPYTKLALINAIYFKGQWKSRFEPGKTVKAPFYVRPDFSVRVPMMYQNGSFLHADLKDYNAQVVVLPYEGNDVSMVVVLPNAKDGLKALEQKLDRLELLKDLLNMTTLTSVDLFLPKFKFETFIDLKPQLRTMGLRNIFSWSTADFSGITKSEKLRVSKIVQKAIIEVNEEGTVASVATGLLMDDRFGQQSVTFRCDHPFLFFLTYNGSFSLFEGRVANPKRK